MSRALDLALRAWGQTSPNPMVGAVMVRGGKIVGEGYHKRAGLPHAEVNALRNAGKRARGADLYVTLEPCCFYGRTPPCTDAIIKAGVKRIFYGMRDPNPSVVGKGLAQLKKQGIKVIGPILEDACQRLNRPYIKWIKTRLPYVTAKIAMTLDGKIADACGNSKWISNERSREYAHWLRAGSDVVMVGAGTWRRDKPRLNVRLAGYKGKQPVPIVVGVSSSSPPHPFPLPYGERVKGEGRSKVNLKKLLRELGAAGFQSILVEGGSKLHTSLIKEGLVDHFIIFIAPKLLGGDALPWLGNIGRRTIKHPLNFTPEHIFMLGDNLVLEGPPTTLD